MTKTTNNKPSLDPNKHKPLYVKSELIGFRHGFFSKLGGVSVGKFAGLNATARLGDDEAIVARNQAIALNELNFKPEQFAFINGLAHGSKVIDVSEKGAGMGFTGYDIIMTAAPRVVIGLAVADCLPIILASEQKQGVVAIAHGGWRGLHDQVVVKAVRAMQELYDVDPSSIKAAIGPGISLESYEFGPEAYDLFSPRYVEKIGKKPHVNTLLMAEDQLAEAGVRQIDVIPIDTFSDERFYSARREGTVSGRNLVIASL